MTSTTEALCTPRLCAAKSSLCPDFQQCRWIHHRPFRSQLPYYYMSVSYWSYTSYFLPPLHSFIYPFIGSRGKNPTARVWFLALPLAVLVTLLLPHLYSFHSSFFFFHSFFFVCFPQQCLLETASGTSILWQPPAQPVSRRAGPWQLSSCSVLIHIQRRDHRGQTPTQLAGTAQGLQLPPHLFWVITSHNL